MHTVPTTPDDADAIGLAAAAERYLNATGLPAAVTVHNRDAVMAAARDLIAALTNPTATMPTRLLPGGGMISGPMIGGDQ
jgi:hypothetical protein